MPRGIKTAFALLAILAGTSAPSIAADSRFAGYLIDRSCADNMKTLVDFQDMLKAHKKECALNESCSKDGYALFSKGKWYNLDKKGSQLAKEVLKSSRTKEGHFVIVNGSPDKSELKVTSLRELAGSDE